MGNRREEVAGRYDRHRGLLDHRQWRRLESLRVVVAGAGGLGGYLLDMLVRLAPLRIEIWDPGLLDAPDLNRQTLYGADELGGLKVELARRRLQKINPDAKIEGRPEAVRFDSSLGESIGGIDACFDCLDTFSARAELELAFLKSIPVLKKAAAAESSFPLFHGGVSGYFGQAAALFPPVSGYARVFGPDFSLIPPSPKAVMPFAAAAVAAAQVGLFMRWLTGWFTDKDQVQLLSIDLHQISTETIEIK